MKELSLSLLSRGCSQVLTSEHNTEGCVGRLDVCFTPNDYYLWKSQESLLRLTSSGRLISAAQSGLPKTYSTRRGPLLLYSQDLVTVKRNVKLEAGNKKKKVHYRNTPNVQKQLSNLRELTTAILSYSTSQHPPSRPAPNFYSPFHFPPVHVPTPLPLSSPRAQPDPAWFVPMNLQWLPAWKHTELQDNSPEKETELEHRNIIRLDVFLQNASPSRNPSPPAKPQPWVHYVATTTEPEDTETYLDMFFQQPEDSGPPYTEMRRRSTEEIQDPNFSCVHDMVLDRSEEPGGAGQHFNTELEPQGSVSGLFLPPLRVGMSTRFDHSGERGQDKIRWRNKVNEQPVILPALFPEKEELTRAKTKGEKENTDRECVKNPTAGQGPGGGT
ncbi:uncharacterized protein LOC107989767 [Cynoglossus semilaevis]|uniref:uncharacterized protein LOC107989767 n=1 Tax=Cynoglossus semilaevis TaxID=244447 RepID=UPI0007DC9B86|nr:uncharacterized protein LOC107989767 [Cynoglossus semilaevis]XP_024919864.1 uncharacterized protein LOC107989767 [Cynoglossus semilaevis]